MKYTNLKLGEILLELGVITESQLQIALEKQKVTKKKLGEVLIDQGIIKRDNLYIALERRLGIQFVDLSKYQINAESVKKITESLARKHMLIPIDEKDGRLVVAMADPLNIYAIEDIIYYTGMDVTPAIASEEQIKNVIGTYFGEERAIAAAEEFKKQYELDQFNEEQSHLEDETPNSPIVKLLDSVFEQAIRSHSSDIHIEPQKDFIRIRYRHDGQLQEIMRHDISLLSAIVVRIKIISDMDIAEKRRPQDGRFSMEVDGCEYDMRVSCLPTIYGEKIVIRIIDKQGLLRSKKDLIYYPDDLKKFDSIIKNSYGMVVITGPTGSGKSTTMYSMIGELNTENINIVTVEDPVEASIDGISQVQVNTKAGLDFSNALRSFLRQDPDVIVVGEIRDSETAEIAVRAAITGHLVISTLHTNDAPSAIARFLDMNIEPFLIGASLVGIIAQRLVRKICAECIEAYTPLPSELDILEIPEGERNIKLYRGRGCRLCNNTGYRGRMGVYEIMPVNTRLRELINGSASTDEIREAAIKDGMITLKASCARLVLEGKTTMEELIRIAYTVE